jgi:hypothetical protein
MFAELASSGWGSAVSGRMSTWDGIIDVDAV